jgi:hypothetical protein
MFYTERHETAFWNRTKMLKALIIVIAFVAVLIGALLYGAYRWNAGTQELRARLDAARVPIRPQTVDFRELEGLPARVQRYFRVVLKEGQPMVAGVRVQHRGTFNLGETTDQWKPFTSDQKVVTQRPGFDWDGRVAMMPGLPVRVHDAYVAGEGILHASLLGLFSLVDLRGVGDVAEGESHGRVWNYDERGGMRVPLDGEVAWLLPRATSCMVNESCLCAVRAADSSRFHSRSCKTLL